MPLSISSFLQFIFQSIKNAPQRERKVRFAPSSFVFLRRIWHLTFAKQRRLPGFTGAVPSTALDKDMYSLTPYILYKNSGFVKGNFRQPSGKRRIDIFRSHRYSNKGKIFALHISGNTAQLKRRCFAEILCPDFVVAVSR